MTAGQDRIAIEVWDFVSSDGSVIITAEEFAELERQCPSIRDVRRMVRAACRGWLRRVPERRRKQMLIQWLVEKAESMRPPKPRRPSGTRKPQYAKVVEQQKTAARKALSDEVRAQNKRIEEMNARADAYRALREGYPSPRSHWRTST